MQELDEGLDKNFSNLTSLRPPPALKTEERGKRHQIVPTIKDDVERDSNSLRELDLALKRGSAGGGVGHNDPGLESILPSIHGSETVEDRD